MGCAAMAGCACGAVCVVGAAGEGAVACDGSDEEAATAGEAPGAVCARSKGVATNARVAASGKSTAQRLKVAGINDLDEAEN